METILQITYLYLLVLLLSLLIERTMEVIMTCWNLCELKLRAHHYWNRRANRLKNKFASRVQSSMQRSSLQTLGLYFRINHYTDVDQPIRPGGTIVLSSRAVRHRFVRTVAFIVTSLLGIALCMYAGINFIAIVQTALAPNTISILEALSPRLQLIISGMIIGLGAEPIHRIIKGLEESRAWLDKRDRLSNVLDNMAESR